MELTGTPFFILTIVLFAASIALALAYWGRGRGGHAEALGGRRRGRGRRTGGATPLGYLGSFATVLFCQFTAIAVVFTWVNDDNQLYANWDDLLGTTSHVRSVPVPPKDNGLAGDQKSGTPKVVASFHAPSSDAVPRDVKETDLKGRLSGVDGEVLVWTPPQYDDPAYKDKNFPVVELLAGYPGSTSTWYGATGMNVTQQLAPLMKSGQITPFILVTPRVNLLQNADTGCADVPGKVNAETWLSRDVPQMVLDNFRTTASPDQWAVAGYSAGAHCAALLALGHPDRYRAAIAMSGYNDPSGESDSLTAKDPKLSQTSNPLYLLTHAATPPNVSLWVSGRKTDGLPDATALQQAAKPPTSVTPIETTGAHLMSTWRPLVVPSFKWLSGIIPAPK
ncbi:MULTISPECIES: alpha/beta hydrolase [Kitasatospora]|uniref:alpha/beta hydrolase n=1 Tax=Kitasatospora TaxID=2063 RepID=UPI000C70FBEF|nr:alpha/beta hydrolase-fold protein [Kitasatospora sp. GP30]MDH6143311.1 enterochelin esterase-like enzyme [Kitasatospora sp. GP30]